MLTRWTTAMIGGVVLFSLTACAESLHQKQRIDMLSQAQENGYADVYDQSNPFYFSPGFWWSPFAYYPGFSGYGPGYRSGYPYYGYPSGRPSPNPGGPSFRPSPPPNAPSRMFQRRK
ncbi:MAG: hypothetical protein JW395_1476 [Nitrospira sp.]|nr:hypothetical protein [Nitrospira sp.]